MSRAGNEKDLEYNRAYGREWYRRNETRVKDNRLRRVFGISLEEYNRLFDLQKGCCAICGRHQSEFRRRLAVDHDHHTKAVRGLLCDNCNVGIGKLKDNPEVMRKAAIYVETRAGDPITTENQNL